MLSKANKLHAKCSKNHRDTMGALKNQVIPSAKGVCGIRACAIEPMQDFPAWRCLQRRRGIDRLPNYDQWSALSKGCFAEYDVRSIGELSRRTMGRLRYLRPARDTAHANGVTAELTQRYSIISPFTARPKHYSVMTMGQPGAAGAWATPQQPPGS
jgi:hypothetical protein